MNAVAYPRGFLGFDIGLLPEKTNANDFIRTVRSIEYNRSPKDVSEYTSNPSVDALWKDHVDGLCYTTAFAFRERILTVALSAFGTQSFYDWCELQSLNPMLNTMHKKFLNDTFMFISTGKRSMNVNTWMNIVRINPSDKSESDCPYEIKEFFRVQNSPAGQREIGLVETIASWTSQENGFDDLLATLMVLFGAIN